MKKILYIYIFSLLAVQGFSQTFCLSYANPNVTGGQFSVDVVVSGNMDFNLGSSNLVFMFNDGALSNPSIVSALPGPPFYLDPTITVPVAGQASINIELGFPGFGSLMTVAGTTIGTITFDIDDSAATSDYSWLYNGGTTQTVVFLDDEATQIFATAGDDSCLMPLNSVLPIRLKRFSAMKGNENTVDLNWTSETEVNSSHFDVQRSQDGSNWTTIGEVEAAGESSTEQDYYLLDDKLPLNLRGDSKTFYYRLNMVDKDGSQEYSDIRVVRFDIDGEASLLVYPNPATNSVFVNLSSINTETGPAELNLFSSTGQLMKKQTLSTNDDIQVDIHNIPAGIYYFMVKHQNVTFTEKVILID